MLASIVEFPYSCRDRRPGSLSSSCSSWRLAGSWINAPLCGVDVSFGIANGFVIERTFG